MNVNRNQLWWHYFNFRFLVFTTEKNPVRIKVSHKKIKKLARIYSETSFCEISVIVASWFQWCKKTVRVEIYEKASSKCLFYNSALRRRIVRHSYLVDTKNGDLFHFMKMFAYFTGFKRDTLLLLYYNVQT